MPAELKRNKTARIGQLSGLPASVLVALMLAGADVRSATAGGTMSCQETLYFGGSQLNIVLGQYRFTGGIPYEEAVELLPDNPAPPPPPRQKSKQKQKAQPKLEPILEPLPEPKPDPIWDARIERDRLLELTAQRLLWLAQLDLFSNAGFGGFSISALLSEGASAEGCESDALLSTITKEFRPATGKTMALMTGQIYQENDAVLFQSYLLPGRFSARKLVPDELTLSLTRPDAKRLTFSVPVWDGEMAFSPRSLSAKEIAEVYERFKSSALMYPEKGRGKPRPVPVPLGNELFVQDKFPKFTFSLLQIDPDGWMRIRLHEPAATGWVRIDPKISESLRKKFPELDFLKGVAGLLLARSTGAAPTRNKTLGEGMERAFASYLASVGTQDPPEQRAAANVFGGAGLVLVGGGTQDAWASARERFQQAVAIDPKNARARNLAILADIARCCMDGRAPDTEAISTIVRGLHDILARQPNDRYALQNLQFFYEYLQAQGIQPQEAADKREQVRAARRVLGYCQQPGC